MMESTETGPKYIHQSRSGIALSGPIIPARLICFMKRTVLVDVVVYFFVILFLYTSLEKLLEPMAGLVAWTLSFIEIGVATLLFIPATRLKGLYASLILMILFTCYLIAILLIDDHLSCTCGGIIENLSPRQHLIFNTATIVLAVIALLNTRKMSSSSRFRWISAGSIVVLFASIGWIILVAASAPVRIRTGFEGRLIPEFTLLLADSTTYLNTSDIPTGKPFIMTGFSPYCRHCQAEMGDIIRHIRQFGDTTIYFVTPYSYSDLKKFYVAFQLEKYPTIVTGVDVKNVFLGYFGAPYIPYTAIYDSKKRLKEVIPGQATAALLSRGLTD